MKFQPTMDSVIRVIKFVLSAYACWPLPPDAKHSDVLLRNFGWWFILIHMSVGSSMFVYTFHRRLDKPQDIIQVATEFSGVVSNAIKMIICKVEEGRLQGLISEMQKFLKQATDKEREVVQFYVDKCSFLYGVILVFCVSGICVFTIEARLSGKPFIADLDYPFSIEPFWIWAILYVSHFVTLIQTTVMVVLDLLYIFLIWFAVARFEIMCLEFQSATNTDDIKRCVRKHQELIEYADRLSITTCLMSMHIVSFTLFAMTTGGFTLINSPSSSTTAKYIIIYIGCGIHLYFFAWPADHLTDMSEKIRGSVYNSAWVDTPKMLQDTLIIAQRSQYPLVIGIRGVLPALSLELFGSVLSATFSYLAMLRAVTAE